MFIRFSHVMMYVTDLDRAVKWYSGILGFTPNFVAPGCYASLRHDKMGCRIDLHPTEAGGKDVGFGPIPNFAVTNLDETLEALKAQGVKVGQPRREGGSPRFVTIWDSEGNALGLEEV
ncbi:MAG TPA: VOC family protein [Planctomycetota bacterium]|jgi:catechol 2,3-dioxygenase-like lactoylglutathione lyase family enzyme